MRRLLEFDIPLDYRVKIWFSVHLRPTRLRKRKVPTHFGFETCFSKLEQIPTEVR